jgi:hypothetical protein
MGNDRSLVLVAGSGRSGTSLFSGVLQRLGYTVPPPEVPADATNPRGFGESQWVVDFHTRLLKTARVQTADARPAAWAQTAQIGLDAEVQVELRTWLGEQFDTARDIVVKDPRLSWFLPLWRRCAEDVGVAPRFVTMLRHPAAVIDSKQRWYGRWQGDVGRAAGWINQNLFTERATRDAPRVYVRYDDLLDDWTLTVAHVGEALDLAVVRDAPPTAMRRVHDFVDRTLSRSRADWEDLKIPAALRAQANEVWRLMSTLVEGTPCEPEELDAARAAYIDLYAEAEAIAQSSIAASKRPAPAAAARNGRVPKPALWMIRRVPEPYRKRIPPQVRHRIIRVLAGS